VALRYGQLYGSGTYFAAGGDFQRQARARILPIVGSGAGIFSFLHVTDAATAAIAAPARGDGVYNITDDEPVAARDWIPAFCREVGAPPPLHIPASVARIVAGSFASGVLTEGRGLLIERPSWRWAGLHRIPAGEQASGPFSKGKRVTRCQWTHMMVLAQGVEP
jgi:nucleoside-diphosphate-sugar epimerase